MELNNDMIREPITDEEFERIQDKYCMVEVNNPKIKDAFTFWGVYKESGFSEEEMFKMADIGDFDFLKLLNYCDNNNYKLSAAVICKDKQKSDELRGSYIELFNIRGILMDESHFKESMDYLYYLTYQTNNDVKTEG